MLPSRKEFTMFEIVNAAVVAFFNNPAEFLMGPGFLFVSAFVVTVVFTVAAGICNYFNIK